MRKIDEDFITMDGKSYLWHYEFQIDFDELNKYPIKVIQWLKSLRYRNKPCLSMLICEDGGQNGYFQLKISVSQAKQFVKMLCIGEEAQTHLGRS